MQAQGFGRKGAPAGSNFGEAAPRTIGSRPQSAPEPVHDPYAEKRAAFLAQERAAGGFAFADVDDSDLIREAKRDGTAAWGVPTSKTWSRSVAIAYLLWFFVGIVSAHRLYTGRYASGAIQAAVGIVAIGMLMTLRSRSVFETDSNGAIGMLMFLTYGAWRLVDLFLIPGMCRKPPAGFR